MIESALISNDYGKLRFKDSMARTRFLRKHFPLRRQDRDRPDTFGAFEFDGGKMVLVNGNSVILKYDEER